MLVNCVLFVIQINKDVVRPFVSDLLDALLICFRDESWPVRDASCVACGNFISCFPKECHFTMEILYELFFENLQDNIPSVRQGAAIALVNVVKAYGELYGCINNVNETYVEMV